jgi:hypothetical protein
MLTLWPLEGGRYQADIEVTGDPPGTHYTGLGDTWAEALENAIQCRVMWGVLLDAVGSKS